MKDCLQTCSRARILRFVSTLLLGLTFTGSAFAQRASISGIVTDQSGGVLPDVHISLLNVDQGLQREVSSNNEGVFSVPWLQPGRYVVSGQKEGFAVAEIKDVVLHVGDTRSVHLELMVGASPVHVEVDGHTQSVETVSSAIGQVVTGDVIRDAPLNGRNVLDLAVLQPGVTPTNDDDNSPGRFNVSGNRSDSVNYLLDGGLNNDLLDNGIVYNPNPDTVAEFRILTSNYPAEFGRNSGGIVSVITKSGGNEFHGSVFDFFRNDALDANSYFNKNDPANLLPRVPLKRNQFGGTLGGPVGWAQRGVNNRLFFFVGYQGERQIQGVPQQSLTFTPQELNGDFSNWAGNGPDPGLRCFLSGLPSQDFPCKSLPNRFFQPDPTLAAQAIIDPQRIDPVARNYINAGLIPTSPTNELNTQENAHRDVDELTAKIDFEPNSKDRIATTFGWNHGHILDPYSFANVPGFADNSDYTDWFTTVAYTHIFYPNLLNELRAGFHRNAGDQAKPAEALPAPADLGIGITPDRPSGPTNLVFDFGLAIGTSPLGPSQIANTTYSFLDTVTWSRGSHSWKAGVGFSPFQNNNRFAFYVDGRFDFVHGGNGSQNSFANFLLGIPASFTQSADASSNLRSTLTSAFIQDEWHAAPHLVLNLGARYEYSTPKRDTQGRTFSIIPGLQSTRFPNAPTGMVFPGDRGAPEGVNFPDRNDWAARVGFAWDSGGRGSTSIRGSFGVFYDLLKGEDNLQFNGQPPFYSSTGFGLPAVSPNLKSPLNLLSQPYSAAGQPNPFPSHTPPPSNIDFTNFLPIGSSGSVFVVDPHLRTPYTYQYSLSMQQELLQNTIAEASYVGSSSHGLTSLIDINPFVLGTADRVLNLEPNGTCLNDPKTKQDCFAALPEFRNVVNASFNSLQLSLRKQVSGDRWFGHSYFMLAYTYSHNIDNASGFRNRNNSVPSYQPALQRAAADMDLRHRLIFSGGWDLPVDRLWDNAPKAATKGWSVFPIVSYRSGFPVDVFANLPSATSYKVIGPSGAGDPGNVRANLIGPVHYVDPRSARSFSGLGPGAYWFDPNSFSNAQCISPDTLCTPGPTIFPSDEQVIANPQLATYGTLSRNYLRAPGRVNVNLAFSKTTPLRSERLNLEFRADFFNIFNRAQFADPNTNINSANFGKIQNTYDPRVIQLALRVSF